MKIQLTSYAVPYTSYGMIGEQLLKTLIKITDRCLMRPLSFNEAFGSVNSRVVANNLVTNSLPDYFDYELVTSPPNSMPVLKERYFSNTKRILFTMWESTEVRTQYVQEINRNFCAVIVPDKYNKQIFVKSGVRVPIHICPLWVDTDLFTTRKQVASNEEVTFGIAARLAHGGSRRNIGSVIEAFKLAFKKVKDARLIIKLAPDCQTDELDISDDRITIIKAFTDREAIRDFYYGLDAYVTASSEGWGWHQHEAVCCGVPLIGVNYGPMQQFFNGYECGYSLVKATGPSYEGVGFHVAVDPIELAGRFKHVYNNTAEAFVLGQTGADKGLKFSIDNFERKFTKIIKEITNA